MEQREKQKKLQKELIKGRETYQKSWRKEEKHTRRVGERKRNILEELMKEREKDN